MKDETKRKLVFKSKADNRSKSQRVAFKRIPITKYKMHFQAQLITLSIRANMHPQLDNLRLESVIKLMSCVSVIGMC